MPADIHTDTNASLPEARVPMKGIHLHLHPAGSRTTVEPHSTLRDARATASAPPLTIAVGRALGTVVVTVRGEIGEHDAPHLNAVLDEILGEEDRPEVVIDLRRLHKASRSAVAAVAAAAALATERGIGFRISESPPQVRSMLEAAGLTYAFGAAAGRPAWVTSLHVG